jgi:nitric oxide reductase subunit B
MVQFRLNVQLHGTGGSNITSACSVTIQAGKTARTVCDEKGSVPDPVTYKHCQLFFWSSWAATTDVLVKKVVSYTSNWPHEPLVENTPTAGAGIWSIASVILMIAAIAGMIFYHSARKKKVILFHRKQIPVRLKPTPSMLATRKYFLL